MQSPGVRDGHRNRKSQKSLRFRCAKEMGNILRLQWGAVRHVLRNSQAIPGFLENSAIWGALGGMVSQETFARIATFRWTVWCPPTGKYGCREVRVYPAECGDQLGRSLQNWELQISCFEEFFGWRERFGSRPC